MTAEQMNALVQGIYDRIFDSATKAEPGGKPLANTAKTMLTLMKPGMAINPNDYRNPWTPGNTSGSQDAAVNTARLVDVIPNANSLYEDSGKTVTQVYGDILNSVSIPVQKKDAALDAQIDAAWNYLFRIVNQTDPDTGAVTPKTIESAVYRDYLDNQSAYQNARLAYVGAYLAAQETPQGKNTWPLVAPTMQIPVKQAWDKWRANFADKVEQNLAILATSSQNSLQKAFNKAKEIFEGYGVTLDDSGGGLSPKIERVSLIPSNWYSSSDTTGWTTVKVSAGNSIANASSDYKSFGASAGFSLGIWSVGAKAGGSWSSQHFSSETNNLSIEFSFKFVGIRRPWMSFHLLDTKTWNLGNFSPKKGGISNGTKTQQKTMWPLMPTGFVVVKGVKIKATWAKSDWDKMQSALSAGGQVGIGPFSIGGSYSQSHSSETWKSAFANGEITVPGVQIIGWMNAVVPYCAPEDMP
ncbi:MAG: hypothetical protein K1X91_10175 [Bacteriodetes bacterium]|nr:hypothetical protein [Bacteroidota bacterium]